jgi:diadenosine tetraphosphate (Ap4A) HIT family hydrolase
VRVILNRHVKEMTDLAERERLMRVVFACESALRSLYQPDKINLASLGNVVPHLHWHVIARFADDAHFPDAIWAAPRRKAATRAAVTDEALARAIMTAL